MPLFSVYHGSNQQNTLLSTDCSAGVLNATLVDIANNNNNNSSLPINEVNHTESTNITGKPNYTKEKNDLIAQHAVKYKHVELIPFSFLHELASNNKTVHLLHQIQRYRHQQQNCPGNTEGRLSLSSLSGNLPNNNNNFIMPNNVNNSGNLESPFSINGTNTNSTSSNVINNTVIQSLLHNIPFVGLMNAPVQLPVCDLPGMSSLTSNIIQPNFSSIGAATSNANLASVIGTNNFVLIGCRESNVSEEQVPHTNLQTHTPSLLSQEQHQHQEEFAGEHYLHNILNSDNNNNDAIKLDPEAILEKAHKISNKSIWQDVNRVALNNYNNTDEGENTQSAHMIMNNSNSNNHTTTTTTTNINSHYIPNAFTRATAQVALNSTLSASSNTSNASSGKGRSNSPSSTSNTSSNKRENNNNNSKNKQKNKNGRVSNSNNNNTTQNTPREKNISKSPERTDLSLLPELSLSMNNKTITTINNINQNDTIDKEKEEELELAKRIQEYQEQHIKPVQHIPVNVHAVHSIMANHSYNDDSNIQYSPARLVTRLLVEEVVREEMQHEKEEKEATNTNNNDGDDLERTNLGMESEYMNGELNTEMFHQIDSHNNDNVMVSNSNTTVSNSKTDVDNITKPKEVQVIYENTEIPLSHAAHSLLNASSNYSSNLSSSFTSATLNNTSSNINMNTLNNTNNSNSNNPFVVSLANCTVNVRNIPITTNNNNNNISCHSHDPFSRNHFISTNDDNAENENTEPWSHLLERMQSFDVIYKTTSSTTGNGKESSKHEDELLSILLEEYLRFMKGKFDVARQQYRTTCEAASGHYSNHRHNSNAINNNNNESGLSKSRSKTSNDKATKKKKK